MIRIIESEKIEHGYKVKIQTTEGFEEFEMPEPEYDYIYYVQSLFDTMKITADEAQLLLDKAMMMAHFHTQLGQAMLIEQIKKHQTASAPSLNKTESGIYIPDTSNIGFMENKGFVGN